MNQVQNLQHVTRELLYLGTDGSPIHTNHFCQLSTEVLRLSEALFSMKGTTFEEGAVVCLSLLMGYNITIYNDGDKESKIQNILNRSFAVLDHLPASLLKCRLLAYCYDGVFEEDLAQEAYQIMDGWKSKALSEEELEVMEILQTMEENSYSCSEIEDWLYTFLMNNIKYV